MHRNFHAALLNFQLALKLFVNINFGLFHRKTAIQISERNAPGILMQHRSRKGEENKLKLFSPKAKPDTGAQSLPSFPPLPIVAIARSNGRTGQGVAGDKTTQGEWGRRRVRRRKIPKHPFIGKRGEGQWRHFNRDGRQTPC